MSCKLLKYCPMGSDMCKQVRNAADCACYNAVMRAFESILEDDEPQSVAFDAALRVYRYHYPQDHKAAAHLTVERWVHGGRIQ